MKVAQYHMPSVYQGLSLYLEFFTSGAEGLSFYHPLSISVVSTFA